MTAELYVRSKGWIPDAEHSCTWQQCYNEEVLAFRIVRTDGRSTYCLFVHNMHGTRYLNRICIDKSAVYQLFGCDAVQVSSAEVQKIFDALELRTANFVNLRPLPNLDGVECYGDSDGVDCHGEARYWLPDGFDGYTDSMIPVCDIHALTWAKDFEDCPFYPPPVLINTE